jgi:hypothetical protein
MTLVGDISLLTIAGAILGTIVKYWWDFRKEQARRRIEVFEQLRKGFDERDEFFEIFDALEARVAAKTPSEKESADEHIRAIDWRKRMRFASFIENIALYAKSGVFSYELANYVFGDYARKCWGAGAFWEDLCDPGKKNGEEPLWTMFKEFVERVTVCDERLTANPTLEMKSLRI